MTGTKIVWSALSVTSTTTSSITITFPTNAAYEVGGKPCTITIPTGTQRQLVPSFTELIASSIHEETTWSLNVRTFSTTSIASDTDAMFSTEASEMCVWFS